MKHWQPEDLMKKEIFCQVYEYLPFFNTVICQFCTCLSFDPLKDLLIQCLCDDPYKL